MRLLVSVRSVDEALLAARGGADLIDCKEPGAGALGGLPLPTIREIVAALRKEGIALPVSATIGDLPSSARETIRARVDEVGACGVDFVKVGIERGSGARELLDWLARSDWPVVPVFIADLGLDMEAVEHAAIHGFAGLMIDTADKHAGSLFDAMPLAQLRAFVRRARDAGVMVGMAGALRASHAPALAALAPDFAGFRSAVCRGDRSGALDAQRLHDLRAAMSDAQTPGTGTSPSSSERMRASSAQ